MPANPSYPDTGGVELTDGIWTRRTTLILPGREGPQQRSTPSLLISAPSRSSRKFAATGSRTSCQEFCCRSRWTMRFLTDNVTFNTVGTVKRPNLGDGTRRTGTPNRFDRRKRALCTGPSEARMERGLDLHRRDRSAPIGLRAGREQEASTVQNMRVLRWAGLWTIAVGSAAIADARLRSAGESGVSRGWHREEVAARTSRWPVLHARRQKVSARGSALGSGQGGDAVAGAVGSEGH